MAIHADYDRIEWLAGQVDAARQVLLDPQAEIEGARLSTGPFGDESASMACWAAYSDLHGRARDAVAGFAAVLEADRMKMRAMVQTYRDTDQATADRIWSRAGTRLDVFSAHTHSHDDGLSRSDDDANRTAQIGNLVDAVADVDGGTLVGADLNVRSGRDSDSSRALGGFEDAGLGDATRDGSIDHVYASPNVTVTHAREVDVDGLSDHDGQAVEFDAPRW
jgi:hypothetical protein